MSFELNVASSSSSSSSSSKSESDQDDDGSVHDVDPRLADELRAALHLAIGKLCRAEDDAEKAEGSSPAFTMSDEAIAALTELTYHYSTSLFSKDLVAFSKHAKRQTVKTDDVLLMARKDKKRMLADLKRHMSQHPGRFTEGTRKLKVQDRRSGSGTATVAARKKASAKSVRSDGGRRSNSNSKSKGSTKRGKQSMYSSSSSSSSSDGGSDDGSGSAITTRRKKLQLERTNLGEGAFRGRGTTTHNDERDESATANGDRFDDSSDSDSAIVFGMQKKKAGREKKALGHEGTPRESGRKDKRNAKPFSDTESPIRRDEDSDNNNDMVIDLASD